MDENFCWSSEPGHILCRKILKDSSLPYEPHDYQIEGVCKSLDGIDLLAITPTGSGKTGYYSMYILVVLAIVQNPDLCPTSYKKFSKNPCLLIICPTKPLELDMAKSMQEIGIKVLAINTDTADEALRMRNEEIWVTARTEPSVIIAGPEQLKSKGFEKALRDDEFYQRICGAFEQMGFMKARLHSGHNPWICTSATVQDGEPFDNICRFLGLRRGHFHVIRRSNFRPDIQMIFRDLVSGISGESFPELDWVLSTNRLTLIFTTTITLSSRIHRHLSRKAAQLHREIEIRMYNSLNFESYNSRTREILLNYVPGPGIVGPIIIGTDSLSVGVDIPAVQDVIIIGDIKDPDEVFQKAGRLGRRKNLVPDPRCFVYISKSVRSLAERVYAGEVIPLKPGELPRMTFPLAQLIVEPCKTEIQNIIYSNPPLDPPCKCTTCTNSPFPPARLTCNCSGCIPDTPAIIIRPPVPPKASTLVPQGQRLSRLMRTHGHNRLIKFRDEIYRDACKNNISTHWMLPADVFLPEHLITDIFDRYALLTSVSALTPLLEPYKRLETYHTALFELLQSLRPEFESIAIARKEENKAKRDKAGNKDGVTVGESSKKTRTEKPVDPNKTPRQPTAYSVYLKTNLPIWKAANPQVPAVEALAAVRLMWKTAPENQKARTKINANPVNDKVDSDTVSSSSQSDISGASNSDNEGSDVDELDSSSDDEIPSDPESEVDQLNSD